jgi:signal peptidase I
MSKKDITRSVNGKKKSVLREYIESFAIALILALVVKCSVVEAYKIPSSSMEDTLLIGDFLLANKFIYGAKIPLVNVHLPAIREPKPGDVVIFKYPGNPGVNYIKRCVAVGGQVVEIRDKVVYVDGKKFLDPIELKHTDRRVLPASASNRDNYGPYKIPEGYIFVMGDNRDNSYDSRFWGPLDRKLVLGKAMILHLSWAPDPKAPEFSWLNPLTYPVSLFYNITHFYKRIRWERLGDIVR